MSDEVIERLKEEVELKVVDRKKQYNQAALDYIDECLARPQRVQKSLAIDGGWVGLVKIKIDILMKLGEEKNDNDMGIIDI